MPIEPKQRASASSGQKHTLANSTSAPKKLDGQGGLTWQERYETLLEGCQPFINAVRTLDSDRRDADKVRDPGSYHGDGYGKSFACFRARARLAYADFEKFNTALKKLFKMPNEEDDE